MPATCLDTLCRVRNSSVGSVLGSLSSMMQHCGFDPPLRRIFLVEGIFPLELTWVLAPFPKNTFGWEYELSSDLHTHAFHHTNSKDPDIHVLDGWMPATKTHPACTIHEDIMLLPQWLHFLKKKVTYAKTLTQKMMNPRGVAGERRRRKKALQTTATSKGEAHIVQRVCMHLSIGSHILGRHKDFVLTINLWDTRKLFWQ